MKPKPSWASPRVSGASSDGVAVSRFAGDVFGVALMPWQTEALTIALQTAEGRRLFRDVTVTVPRQQGKTTLLLMLALWTLLGGDGRRVVYAAQSRIAARQKLLSGWWPAVRASGVGDRFSVFRANGSEALQCDNGSELVLMSSDEHGGHGETADLVILDECWSYPDDRVEMSARPMMSTRSDAQLWAVSTAGSAGDSWWWDRLAAARTCAELGMPDGQCLIEYSASPEADPFDEKGWGAFMPALGRTVAVESLRADLAGMGPGPFSRAYMNRRPSIEGEGWAVISRDVWEAARWDGANG
jgi:phage terminase large subunit-like protein